MVWWRRWRLTDGQEKDWRVVRNFTGRNRDFLRRGNVEELPREDSLSRRLPNYVEVHVFTLNCMKRQEATKQILPAGVQLLNAAARIQKELGLMTSTSAAEQSSWLVRAKVQLTSGNEIKWKLPPFWDDFKTRVTYDKTSTYWMKTHLKGHLKIWVIFLLDNMNKVKHISHTHTCDLLTWTLSLEDNLAKIPEMQLQEKGSSLPSIQTKRHEGLSLSWKGLIPAVIVPIVWQVFHMWRCDPLQTR